MDYPLDESVLIEDISIDAVLCKDQDDEKDDPTSSVAHSEEESELDEFEDSEWRRLVGKNTVMTDAGEQHGEMRYAVWVYKDKKHHIARVGGDGRKLQKYFKVDDSMIFRFNLNHLIGQEEKKQKKKWNYGSASPAYAREKMEQVKNSDKRVRRNRL
jgi:hypothetical protein